MHPISRVFLLSGLITSLYFSVGFAQSKVPTAGERVHQWIEQEYTRHPAKRELARRIDSYDRTMIREAAKALKIPFSQLADIGENETLAESMPFDSGLAVNASASKSYSQNETSIAISRTSPNIIVAGSNDIRMVTLNFGMPAFYTTNFGTTWKTAFVPLVDGYTSYGDPALAAGSNGVLYYTYLLMGTDGQTGNIIVATSKDGQTWKNGSPVISDQNIVPPDGFAYIEDKEQVCIDESPLSPHKGRLYVVWVHFVVDMTQFQISETDLQIAYSDNNGDTWSDPVIVDNIPGQFPSIHTGKFGEVFVSYSDNVNYVQLLYHGKNDLSSFSKHEVSDFTTFLANVDGRESLKGRNGFRCFPYTSFDVDLSSNTIHYVFNTWKNKEAEIVYSTSSDFGANWSPQTLVTYPDGNASTKPHDRFCPWVTVNQNNHDALVTYYSSERDDNNKLISAFRKRLNGPSTEPSKPLEATDFSPLKIALQSGGTTPFLGDYIGSDLSDTVYAAAWAQGNSTNSDGEVYVYVGLPTHSSNNSVPTLIHSDRLRLASVFPNPIGGNEVKFNYYSPEATHAALILYSIDGKRLATIWSGDLTQGSNIETAILNNISAGAYLLRLETPTSSDELKIVKE